MIAVAGHSVHSKRAPVQKYVEYMSKLMGKPFHVVTIPEGSAAYRCGYRFASVPDDELAYYLEHGAERSLA